MYTLTTAAVIARRKQYDLPRKLRNQADIFGQGPKCRHSLRIGWFGYMVHYTGKRDGTWAAPKYVPYNDIVWC
jgi:hypothetical protein